MGYMSPEIILGEKADNRSDIFSLGVTLYELITDLQPFVRESDAATLHATAYDIPVSALELVPEIPVELNEIINKAIKKDPDERYQSIEIMLKKLIDLRGTIESVESFSKRSSSTTRGIKQIGSRTLIISIMVLIAILIYLIPDYRQKVIDIFDRDSLPEQIHLAVLPFVDLSENNSDQIFSIGLADIITSKITQLEQYHESLFVIPASDIRQRKIISASEAYHVFGANLAVSGTVQVVDENIRLTMNLIDTKSVRQLQSSIIDIPFTDLVTFQDTSIDVILSMLNLRLQADDKEKIYSNLSEDNNIYELYVKGRGFLYQSELINTIDSAILYFREILKIDSMYVPAMAGLSEACWEKYILSTNEMFKDLAFYYIDQAKGINDQDANVYLTSGKIFNETGRYEKAVEEFSKAIKIDSLNRMAYKWMADALVSLNKLDSAETVYRKSIAVKPDYWAGYISLSRFYIVHGRNDEALNQLEILYALNPEGYDVFNNLGAIYYGLGEIDKAKEVWIRSIEIKSNFGALSNLATVYYLEEDYKNASQYYRQALDLNILDYRLWFNYASTLKNLKAGKERVNVAYNKGIQLAESKLEINPNDTWLLAELADAYASVKDHEKSIPLIEKALSLEPENIDIKVNAGIIYEAAGDRAKALNEIAYAINNGFPKNQIDPLPELKYLLRDPALDSLLIQN